MKYIVKVFNNGDLMFQMISSSIDDILAIADHYIEFTVKVSLLTDDGKEA